MDNPFNGTRCKFKYRPVHIKDVYYDMSQKTIVETYIQFLNNPKLKK